MGLRLTFSRTGRRPTAAVTVPGCRAGFGHLSVHPWNRIAHAKIQIRRHIRCFLSPKSIAQQLCGGHENAISWFLFLRSRWTTACLKNGVVVLPPEAQLPEGTEVRVEPLELIDENEPFIQAVLKLAKPRPHWPKDYALNHGHYVSGEPKKS